MSGTELLELAKTGLERAKDSLTSFTMQELGSGTVAVSVLDLAEIPLLAGDPEKVTLASYVQFEGDYDGQVIMFFKPDTLEEMAGILSPGVMDDLPTDDIQLILESTMTELANVVGSAVINAFADSSGMRLYPTPPILVRDMVGAILGSAMTCVSAADAVHVIHIKITLAVGGACFEIVFLPRVSSYFPISLGNGVGLWSPA